MASFSFSQTLSLPLSLSLFYSLTDYSFEKRRILADIQNEAIAILAMVAQRTTTSAQ